MVNLSLLGVADLLLSPKRILRSNKLEIENQIIRCPYFKLEKAQGSMYIWRPQRVGGWGPQKADKVSTGLN